eukprot:TRINITY_DN6995_c0_g1_i1.p1 TRINITY_DN6995_c0_g1~~TRINITY_DN6995_c0_g1_i1.p1  ORF type:complete len:501 (+),score=94.86 TRINITY_DN6995_c0_g1_i1:245-1747(+)
MSSTIENEDEWTKLDISNRKIRTLSPNISIYSNLTELYLQNNSLKALPLSFFSSLTNLQHLDLSNNQFSWVQLQICNLLDLKVLNLNWNQIRELPNEMGKLFRLESLMLDGNPISKPTPDVLNKDTSYIIGYLRDRMQAGDSPPPRKWIKPSIVPNYSYNKEPLRVISYNVLAESYVDVDRIQYCPSWALPWDYRKKRILNEILYYKADVICLQEVEHKQFVNFFEPELAEKGYVGKFQPKSRARTMDHYSSLNVDGCCIFWKEEYFTFVDQHIIEYQALCMQKHETIAKEGLNRIMTKDNVALAVLLQPIAELALNDDSGILFVNTHMHWDPLFSDVKLMQVKMLMEEIEDFVGRYENELPIVCCGDFNVTPDSGAYKLISTGKIEKDHADWLGYDYGEYSSEPLTHSLHFKSSYSAVLGGEPDFTNYTSDFIGVLDYIWFSDDFLTTQKVLETVSSDIVKSHNGALPNPWMCSDHIPIVAEIHEKHTWENFEEFENNN